MSENFIPSQSSKPKHFTKALGRPWPKHGINLSQTNNLTKKDGNITKLPWLEMWAKTTNSISTNMQFIDRSLRQ